MNTTYQAVASTIGFKLGASEPTAKVANNPNIIQTKQEYSRSSLAADLSKAGMLQRASDYMRRVMHPEENKDEPLQKDPETPNPFSAENKRSIESPFHQTYDAIKSFRTNNSDNKYNPASNEKKQKKPYDSLYDIYNGVQYRPEGGAKKEKGKNKILSLVEKLEKKAEQYISKFYNPNRDDDGSKQEGSYEGNGIVGSIIQKAKGYFDASKSQGAKTYNFRKGAGDYFTRIARNLTSFVTNYSMPVEHGREEDYTPLIIDLGTQIPQSDLEATILDVEEFLRSERERLDEAEIGIEKVVQTQFQKVV